MNSPTRSSSGPLALVVDADPVPLAVVSKLVEQAGYDVTVVRSGTDAVRQLSSRAFSLVVSEYQISTITGLDLFEYVRKPAHIGQPAFVLATSPATKRQLEAMGKELPVILLKPFGVQALQSAILEARSRGGE